MNFRKGISLILAAMIIMFIMNCTILPLVSDPNNIYDWIKKPVDGTEFRYAERYKYDWQETWSTDNYTIEITDIDERNDRTLIEYQEDDSNDRDYIIIDKIEQCIVRSEDDYVDDNDFMFLKTPVQKDNDWNNDRYDYEIVEMGASKTVEAGTYSDCIVIRYDNGQMSGEMYYSPSAGTYVFIDEEYDIGFDYSAELERISQ